MNIYDAEYWACRYLETYANDVARRKLAAEVGAKMGESVLEKMMEHWKKLADQPTRPVCGCGHPELHRTFYCSKGASPEDQAASKAAGEGSIPSAPATSLGQLLSTWRNTGDVKLVTIRYKDGAVITTDGQYSTYTPADWKIKHVHGTAASFETCSKCNPKPKMDHLPEGSH